MPRNLKLFVPNKPYLITSRTECGLYFLPTEFMNILLEGIIAKAANEYEVDICHYYWTMNHFHMILIPREVEALPKFVKYIKQESSHYINRLLGRKKRTIWCQSYDCPRLLSAEKVLEKIAYLYNNPVKDRIIDSIDNYTGVSSWKKFKHKVTLISGKRIPRCCISAQQSPENITKTERKTLVWVFKNIESETNSFTLKPYDCLRCFPEFEDTTDDEIYDLIIDKIKSEKAKIPKDEKPIHNKKTLKMVQIDLSYEPKKFGKKMVALCEDIEIRSDYISWYKGICAKAKEVYALWKQFKLDAEWPKYLFPPAKPRAIPESPLYYPI